MSALGEGLSPEVAESFVSGSELLACVRSLYGVT